MSELKGLDAYRAKLQRIKDGSTGIAGVALFKIASQIKNVAVKDTPYVTRDLQKSAAVSEPYVKGTSVAVEISFGGPTAPYAPFVHEHLENKHPNGGHAKFLETACLTRLGSMPEQIAYELFKSWSHEGVTKI